ncbi:MAG: NFACT RNA binding domain-containing protein [Planctomycetota bacterium]
MDADQRHLGVQRRGALGPLPTDRDPALAAAHLAELLDEVRPLLIGATIREVEGLPPTDLLVVAVPANDERVLRLVLAADPDHARVHLAIGPVERHKGPVGPFFRTVAERLEGARIEALELIDGDRIVRLDVARDGRRSALIAELTGRHSNLVLGDGARRPRVEALLSTPKPGSRAAERLVVGEPYERPPGAPPGHATPPLAELLPAPPPKRGLAELAPLSWRVEASLGAAARAQRTVDVRADLARRLARRRKSTAARLAGLVEQARIAERVDRLRQDAELLKAALGDVPRGAREITLVDWFDPEQSERTVELDPKRSPLENLERLFARAKKLERTARNLPAEQALAEAELAGLDALLERVEAGDPAALEAEAVAAGWIKPRQAQNEREAAHKKAAPRLPYHRFTGLRGSEIRVGRSAKDNDRLTTREARGNDLWLHTADTPGSHVVLRLERGREPDDDEVLDAATLAVHFSPLAGAKRARVHVAFVKHVKKPKGVPPGTVHLSGGKIREVRVEPRRLERLLGSRHAGSDEGR